MIARFDEFLQDVVDVFLIAGFEHDLQVAGVDVGRFPGTVVMYRDNIGTHAGDDAGHANQLAGAVHQFDG